MKPYQRRVIDEKNELDKKAKALSSFIGLSDDFATIAADEQERLKEQCEIMWEYSAKLGARIAAFEGELMKIDASGNTAKEAKENLEVKIMNLFAENTDKEIMLKERLLFGNCELGYKFVQHYVSR